MCLKIPVLLFLMEMWISRLHLIWPVNLISLFIWSRMYYCKVQVLPDLMYVSKVDSYLPSVLTMHALSHQAALRLLWGKCLERKCNLHMCVCRGRVLPEVKCVTLPFRCWLTDHQPQFSLVWAVASHCHGGVRGPGKSLSVCKKAHAHIVLVHVQLHRLL